MHSYRKNGRLVLEAVSVLPQNSFHVQRQEGRLLLTLISNPTKEEQSVHVQEEEEEEGDSAGELEQKSRNSEKKGKETEELKVEKQGFMMEQAPKHTSEVINVHGSALMIKKLIGLDNRNTAWPNRFNEAINWMEFEVGEEEEKLRRQSLLPPPIVARLTPSPSPSSSPPPPPAATTSFNAYEYFWRNKPVVASIIKPITQQCTTLRNNSNKALLPKSLKRQEQQELVLMRGNRGDYLVPVFRGCKEPRRSLLIWEPCCIATS